MIYYAREGQRRNGFPIGILAFGDTTVAQVPGCVGNASTYSFPVVYEGVKDYSWRDLFAKDHSKFPAVLEAAKALERQGVRAISANCGFFALYQKELAEALSIPVFLSSLLQVPFLARGLGKGEKVGILTANDATLDEEFLRHTGITSETPIAIAGLQNLENFRSCVLDENGITDTDKICEEVVGAAVELVKRDPSIRIMLLECSELPPYAHKVQEAINMPVFDFYTMINYVFTGVVRKPFDGIM